MESKWQLVTSIFIVAFCYKCQLVTNPLTKAKRKEDHSMWDEISETSYKNVTRRERQRNDDKEIVGATQYVDYTEGQVKSWFSHRMRKLPASYSCMSTTIQNQLQSTRKTKKQLDNNTLHWHGPPLDIAAQLALLYKLQLPTTPHTKLWKSTGKKTALMLRQWFSKIKQEKAHLMGSNIESHKRIMWLLETIPRPLT